MRTPVLRNVLDGRGVNTDRSHDYTDQTTFVIQVDVAMQTAGGPANNS